MPPQQIARPRRMVHALGHDVALTDAGAGAAVVLVHGIGVSSRYFGPLVDELSATGRVLAPDLPGFGASSRPPWALSVEEHSEVVAEVMAEAGTGPAVLVGHSMGAQVVTELAVRHPELTERVVLVGPVTEPGARTALRQASRLARNGFLETPRANAVQVSDWLRAGPRRYAATLPTMLEHPLEDRLPLVERPVTLVRGVHDPVAPAEYLQRLARRARDADVVHVPGEGHVVMYRSPRAVADLCRGVRC